MNEARRRVGVVLPIAVGAIGLTAVGCGSGDDGGDGAAWAADNIPGLDAAIVEAACGEGELSLYNVVYRNELQDVVSAFEEAFPCIEVTSFAATGSELLERFTSEQRAGRHEADIFETTTPGVAPELAGEGLLADYTPPNADRVPDQFKDEGTWYAIGLDPIGFAWNTDLVTDEQRAAIDGIETWADTADPAFADDLGFVTAKSGGTAQLPWYYFRTELGMDFWEELAGQNPAIFDATGPAVDRLVAGDFAIMTHAPADNSVGSAWVNGAPVQWVFPSPGLAVPHFVTIAENAPNPNAARLFVAWSLSDTGQSTWSVETGLAPVADDVEDQRDQASESWYALPAEYWDVDWAALTATVPEMGDDFTRIFGR